MPKVPFLHLFLLSYVHCSLQITDLVWTVCTAKSPSASGDADLFRAVFLNRTRARQDCKPKAYAALSCHRHRLSFHSVQALRANSKVENSFELGKLFLRAEKGAETHGTKRNLLGGSFCTPGITQSSWCVLLTAWAWIFIISVAICMCFVSIWLQRSDFPPTISFCQFYPVPLLNWHHYRVFAFLRPVRILNIVTYQICFLCHQWQIRTIWPQ